MSLYERLMRVEIVIQLYEKYKLKDGRTGWAVDILGQGEACILELDIKGFEDRIITVTKEEISEKICYK
jgi:hypothetical protein